MTETHGYSLDLGSSKFCLALLRSNRKKAEIEVHACPSKGIRNGRIVDFSAAKDQLSLLIEQAEHKFNTDVYEISVSITGNNTNSLLLEAELHLENQQVENSTLVSLYKQAIEKASSTEKLVLHVTPLGFQINGEAWYENPIGMRAKKITARYFILQGNANYAKEIVRICNESGLKVENLYAAPFAASTPFLTHTLKKMGVAILDLGGGTSTGLIYIQEKPVESFSLPIGADTLTHDLSIGLSISHEEAEKIKNLWGAETDNPSEIIEISDVHGKKKVVTKEKVLRILIPRIQEIAAFLEKKISRHKSQIGAGLLLTGGGSEVKGIEKVCNATLKIPCNLLKLVHPEGTLLTKETHQRAFSCVIGMLLLEDKNKKDLHNAVHKSSVAHRLVSFFSRT